jgi:hypothetical protein
MVPFGIFLVTLIISCAEIFVNRIFSVEWGKFVGYNLSRYFIKKLKMVDR